LARKFKHWFGILLLAASLCAISAQAEDLQAPDARPLRKYVKPALPEIARKMQLKGTVKLEASVSSAGKVTGVRTIGGHPILVQAATQAVKDWVFEPNGQPGTTLVTLEFK
jgi:TonB family protein